MKKQLKFTLLMMLIIILAACGGDEETSTSGTAGDSSSEETTNTTETTAADEVEELTLRLGLVVGEWSPHYTGAKAFADALQEESGGKIELQIFPDAQLGGEREMFEAVQSGTLDIGLVSSVVFAAFDPKMSVVEIPYLVSTFDDAEKLMDSELGSRLNESLKTIGIHNLGWGHNDFRIITNNKNAVKLPEDLKGIKMRVPENEVLTKWFQQEGALSTVMQFPDIYAALQQGVIEGQDNGPILSYAAKFIEHQKYVTVSNHQYSPVGFLMNEKKWSGYNTSTKEVIEKAAKKAVEAERKAIRDFNATAISQMEAAGLEVHHLTDEEKAAFKQSTLPFLEEIRKTAGDDLVDLAISLTNFEQ